jgi:Fur family transcriptional regulator, peroxide stress response regulator
VHSRGPRDSSRLAQRLRESGLRATTARLAILAELAGDRRHPSVEMVYESLRERYPSLSMSTVYATIESFLQRGIVRQVFGRSGKLRVDGTPHDHDHAVCRSCGRVFDVDPSVVNRPASPPKLPGGLRVTSVSVEYQVVCSQCGGADSSAPPTPKATRLTQPKSSTMNQETASEEKDRRA